MLHAHVCAAGGAALLIALNGLDVQAEGCKCPDLAFLEK